ncbi:MAG: hypothetical protein M3Z20_20145, partial [Chloroflexota bacterium]|nr:hypothetical protein [Chloroflexota bacterium]
SSSVKFVALISWAVWLVWSFVAIGVLRRHNSYDLAAMAVQELCQNVCCGIMPAQSPTWGARQRHGG